MGIVSTKKALLKYLNEKWIPKIKELDPDITVMRPGLIQEYIHTNQILTRVDMKYIGWNSENVSGDLGLVGCDITGIHTIRLELIAVDEELELVSSTIDTWGDALIKIIKADSRLGDSNINVTVIPSISYEDFMFGDEQKKIMRKSVATLEIREQVV